jgi:hypothetical protein
LGVRGGGEKGEMGTVGRWRSISIFPVPERT